MTLDGQVIGTAAYMSPEQARGESHYVDRRSDIYSLGVILFELLTGQRPFQGPALVVLHHHIHDSPPCPTAINPEVPCELEAICLKCLEKVPSRRFATAATLAAELEGWWQRWSKHGPPVPFTQSGDRQNEQAHSLDNVQFTVFGPKSVIPAKWYPLIAFAHLEDLPADAAPDEPDPIEEVYRQAERTLGERYSSYRDITADSSHAVPRDGLITFVPEIDGILFNPPRATITWQEFVHRVEFRLQAMEQLNGTFATGHLSVFLGAILIAHIGLRVRVDRRTRGIEEELIRASGRSYRKIFASYSPRDQAIVDQIERYALAIGDRYLRECNEVRAGDVWDDRKLQLIDEADVFQIFWSTNSMRSGSVRREWEHALSLLAKKGPGFIRPTYWESPLPEAADENLPPPELRRLHFTCLTSSAAKASADELSVSAGSHELYQPPELPGYSSTMWPIEPDEEVPGESADKACKPAVGASRASPCGREEPRSSVSARFRLREMLVVAGIFGVLLAIGFPAVQAAREAARRNQCNNNLRRLALAAHDHHNARGYFPPGMTSALPHTQHAQLTNNQCMSVFTYLLPFLEQTNASDLIHTSRSVAPPGTSAWFLDGSTVAASHMKSAMFVCPSAPIRSDRPQIVCAALNLGAGPGAGMFIYGPSREVHPAEFALYNQSGKTTYLGCAGLLGNIPKLTFAPASSLTTTLGTPVGSSTINYEGVFGTRTRTTYASIKDGTSNVFLFGENYGGLGSEKNPNGTGPHFAGWLWISSGHLNSIHGLVDSTSPRAKHWYRFHSDHPSIVQFTMADGSVKGMSTTVDLKTYIEISSMRDGVRTSIAWLSDRAAGDIFSILPPTGRPTVINDSHHVPMRW